MRDDARLRDRFRGLDRLEPSGHDIWADATGPGRGTSRIPPRRGRIVAAVVAAAVAVAGVVVAVRAFHPAPPKPVSPSTPVHDNGELWFRVGGGDGPSRIDSVEPDGFGRQTVFGPDPPVPDRIAFSPDGSRIAFSGFSPAIGQGIGIAGLDGSGLVPLVRGPEDSWPSWSPDGTQIAFSGLPGEASNTPCIPGGDSMCPTDVFVVDVNTHAIRRLTSDPAPEFAPVWSPDGARIAFVRALAGGNRTAVFSMAADGTDVRRISSADGGSDFAPTWSPDGTQVAFASIRNEDWGIWIVNADGTDEHRILGGGGWHAEDPVWSPDGRLIAFVGNLGTGDYSEDDSVYLMRPDGSDVVRLASAPGFGVADVAWQPLVASSVPTENAIAFVRGGPNGGIYAVAPDGTGLRPLVNDASASTPAWSPDGSRIAFESGDGSSDIFTMRADGSGRMRLTSDGASTGPTWSPDGRRIAFARETPGSADIYAMDADGSDLVKLTSGPLRKSTPDWSPDGSRIAFVGYDAGPPPSPTRIYTVSVEGSEMRAVGPQNSARPRWSPNGTRIVFVNESTGSIWVMNADGTQAHRVVDLASIPGGGSFEPNFTVPSWSPDGSSIVFAAGNAAASHLYVATADGSSVTQLTTGPASDEEPAWSRPGE
ncbi:MAG TPA: hypothetical protein VID47_03705 [Actinomycetota bacterium]|jgi:Tol biopolymer transport system component